VHRSKSHEVEIKHTQRHKHTAFKALSVCIGNGVKRWQVGVVVRLNNCVWRVATGPVM